MGEEQAAGTGAAEGQSTLWLLPGLEQKPAPGGDLGVPPCLLFRSEQLRGMSTLTCPLPKFNGVFLGTTRMQKGPQLQLRSSLCTCTGWDGGPQLGGPRDLAPLSALAGVLWPPAGGSIAPALSPIPRCHHASGLHL